MALQVKNFQEYKEAYQKSVENPALFWEEQANTFQWHRKWDKVLDWNFEEPNIKWFEGAKLNITENCIDRHLKDKANQTAIIWEPNDPNDETIRFTYQELHDEVCKTANMLKSLGIKKGDVICFYMPMVPQLAISVLACARIGAIHSVVFAGFSAKALADRINDASVKMVICTDGNNRGSKQIAVKKVVDEAIELGCPSVEKVLMLKHTHQEVNWNLNLDILWSQAIKEQPPVCPATVMDAEDVLFILYTSGSTGKPKGVVHTCAGYMVYTTFSFKNVFQYQEGDIYWCTADIGWITGHSYIIYGPLAAGATSIMFEGVPTYPDAGRFWEICDKYKVNQFYTAPTAIRALMAKGDAFVDKYNLDSLKVLGSVGEPINKEAWEWYDNKIGKNKCPIVDTWWQTETGGMMISNLAGVTPQKATFATLPLPGIQPCLVDTDGNEIEGNDVEGLLCIKHPWPSMLRTTYGDHERCKNTYFSVFKGKYFTGDGARRDKDGLYRIIGRVDDVINVSGHRLGTAEVENAINACDFVIESAVVGYPHEIKGQGIFAYVICNSNVDNDRLEPLVRDKVSKIIGPIAKPDKVLLVSGLPKTRSGKIMRRILRKIAEKEISNLGDISTLLNPEIVDEIIEKAGLKTVSS